MVLTKGEFYNKLKEQSNYSEETEKCIENTVSKLTNFTTTSDRPGMLLGKIQSGKTRAFIGTIGLAFDNGYDVAIVLTKGTRALAQQTYERLSLEFKGFKDEDELQIFDIMQMPNNLVQWELNQKMIIVVKKEVNNLKRLYEKLFGIYPSLKSKKILIIDDEADFASIGFEKTKQQSVDIKKIAGQIDEIRSELENCSFLQVTATPYSLYLQPENLTIAETGQWFKPIKPAFTELVPYGDAYIGGEFYFEKSSDEDSISSCIYEEVSLKELETLKKSDRRRFKIEEALTSDYVVALREAIINFIVGGCIRNIQHRECNPKSKAKKFSFIVHTEQKKTAHDWQNEIVSQIVKQFTDSINNNEELFNKITLKSYNNLKKSTITQGICISSYEEVKKEVIEALQGRYLMITTVNSEKDVNELLDENGQLKLRTPLNIFIGGQILDRGITIGNLIGFYYGRNPDSFQQDTVLQHSRMYGYRPVEDLAITRFYTTMRIYESMKSINEFDESLRQKIANTDQDNAVVFIQKDSKNSIVPCSPNKIFLSQITTIKPFKRLLPTGFQTGYKYNIQPAVKEVDVIMDKLNPSGQSYFKMNISEAVYILRQIEKMFVFEPGYEWDVEAMISAMEYLSKNTSNMDNNGMIWGICRRNRNISRTTKEGRFMDSPDTPRSEQSEGRVAKEIANDIPALILLRENGSEELGWKGEPFWWPVLVAPKDSPTIVYSSKEVKVE